MVKDYMLDKVLDNIRERIGIIKLEDTRILVDTDDKILHVILLTSAITDYGKFYPQIFLEEEFYDKYTQNKVYKDETQQDGGIATCQMMRKKKYIQFLLIRVESVKS